MKNTTIIKLMLLILIALTLSSCGKSKPVLYIFNWSDYIDPVLIKEFEVANNCKIKYSTYDSNENMITKIKSARESFDVVFPSGDHVSILKEAGLLESLNRTKLTNYRNLNSGLLSKAQVFDNANEYSVPYFWGLTGLMYNKRYVPAELVAKQSWSIVGDPFFKAKNKVTMLDDAREVIGAALVYNGFDLNDTSEAALATAKKTLDAWDVNITQFDSDSYKNEVPDGTTWLAQSYNGDVLQQMAENKELGFFLPSEGSSLWMDNVVILKSSQNKELAYKFLDFLLEVNTAKRNAEYTQYATPNKAAHELLSDDIKNNALIYPSQEYLAKCYMIMALGNDVKKIDALYEAIKMN
ncbi:MAG: spermidine/putrescine ABC transporter substrate-binding protein [Candidatus Cloacimonetes bacterium]|nr:spermidine/putrescine ABC transporter substrate-binding protein [Candidatus Cloacimonadota bacterium]MDD3235333.1 spermidine/putrescine ABC transporter substrate-binding protein [Candidatus Cloacimonadota bacterium]